jgi:hypothetical protein
VALQQSTEASLPTLLVAAHLDRMLPDCRERGCSWYAVCPTLTVLQQPSTHTVGCHRRTVLSLEPDAMRECWDEKATEYTAACREVHSVSVSTP